ncbi:MAG: glycosyltransferase family 4 protein [Verrucomicrobia bacterium]|nr:glycosyltransferase family 4 protein [Verrucomicrobiota bacterium]
MRIGLDVAQTAVERAGCGWYADSLARALAEEIRDRHELVLYHQFGDWLNGSCARATRLDLPGVTMPLLDVPAARARAIWEDPAHPLLGRPDIVHATSVRMPRVSGAKLVFTVHDVAFWTVPEFTTEANRLACQRGTLQAVERADGVIFISESARNEFAALLPGWLEEAGVDHTVIHHGSRHAPSGSHPMVASDPFWLAVGTLEPRKNYEALLTALPHYREQSSAPAPVWIAGGGGWKSDRLKDELRAAEAAGWVRYLGYVSEEELLRLYCEARALLFPSWYEGFGLPVLEALQQGCAVICSDRTSLPEIGGEVARYIDPASPRSLAVAMLELEQGPPFDRARARAQAARFSWARAAQETLQFYERVLASGRPPRAGRG